MLDANRAAAEPVFEPLGYLDDDPAKLGINLGGVRVLGPLAALNDYPDALFVDGLNGTELTARKQEILRGLALPRERYATVVHPSASVSMMAELGAGSVILQNATVNSAARVGNHVMVLPNSVVSHDTAIDDYCYLAPGVVLAGYVRVREGAYLGARSAVTHRVTIGERAVVGIGSVVLADVPADWVVAGTPARRLR